MKLDGHHYLSNALHKLSGITLRQGTRTRRGRSCPAFQSGIQLVKRSQNQRKTNRTPLPLRSTRGLPPLHTPSCAHSHQEKASWPSCCKAASSWVSLFSHTNQTHCKAFADTAGMSRCQSIRRYAAAIAHLRPRGARPVTAATLSGMPLQWRTAAASYLQDTKNGSNTKNQQLTHAQYCSH